MSVRANASTRSRISVTVLVVLCLRFSRQNYNTAFISVQNINYVLNPILQSYDFSHRTVPNNYFICKVNCLILYTDQTHSYMNVSFWSHNKRRFIGQPCFAFSLLNCILKNVVVYKFNTISKINLKAFIVKIEITSIISSVSVLVWFLSFKRNLVRICSILQHIISLSQFNCTTCARSQLCNKQLWTLSFIMLEILI